MMQSLEYAGCSVKAPVQGSVLFERHTFAAGK